MEPKSAQIVDPKTFSIRWKDGVTSTYSARQLRLACPCAQCIEEWTGRAILDPATVREDLTLLEAELVGRYAMTFRWSDGHQTGIFTWPRLRQLGGVA